MRRRLFAALAAVSAVLGVAVFALWLRSHRTADYIGRAVMSGTPMDGVDTVTAFRFNLGELQFSRQSTEFHQAGQPYPNNSAAWSDFTMPPSPSTLSRNVPTSFNFFGLACGDYALPIEKRSDGFRVKHRFIVSVPHWLLGTLLAMPVSMWWRKHRLHAEKKMITSP